MSGLNPGAALEGVKTSGVKASGKTGDPKAVKVTDPQRKTSKPDGSGIEMATHPPGKQEVTVMVVTAGPPEFDVPPATVTVDGMRQAHAEGFAVRFAPAAEETGQPVMGDGYFVGGVTDPEDPEAKKYDGMAKKFGLDPVPRMSQENWNQTLSDSLFVGVGMTVSGMNSDGSMGSILDQLSQMKVRVVKAGKDVQGTEKNYKWGGRESFNKMGQRQLSEMGTQHATPDLSTLAQTHLPDDFAKLPDTVENRTALIQALTSALIPEVSAGINQ